MSDAHTDPAALPAILQTLRTAWQANRPTLERKHFVELAQQEKTQARIAHMLKTGKPLRN